MHNGVIQRECLSTLLSNNEQVIKAYVPVGFFWGSDTIDLRLLVKAGIDIVAIHNKLQIFYTDIQLYISYNEDDLLFDNLIELWSKESGYVRGY